MAANWIRVSSWRSRQKGGKRATYVFEQTQHLVVGSVVGQEETQVRVTQHGRDSDQPSTTTRHNSHVLPGILALLVLTVHLIVQVGDRLPQGSNTGGGTILATGHGDVDGLGPLEAARDVVFYLRGALTQVGPVVRVLEEAVLGGALGAPDDAGGGAAGVEAGVGHVAFVGIAELAMDLGLDFWVSGQLLALAFTANFWHDVGGGVVVVVVAGGAGEGSFGASRLEWRWAGAAAQSFDDEERLLEVAFKGARYSPNCCY